jgi:hypothetical protein
LSFFRSIDPVKADVLGSDLQRITINDIGPAVERIAGIGARDKKDEKRKKG